MDLLPVRRVPRPATSQVREEELSFPHGPGEVAYGSARRFQQKDLDGDGQITMAEFATSWTEATAAEFTKYDLNNDGVITPDEVLKVLGKTTSVAKTTKSLKE